MRAAKVQASLRIRAVSSEPPLLAHTSNESRGTIRQKARSLAPLNGSACAVKICHDGMLEDTNSLDAAHIVCIVLSFTNCLCGSLFITLFININCETGPYHPSRNLLSCSCLAKYPLAYTSGDRVFKSPEKFHFRSVTNKIIIARKG